MDAKKEEELSSSPAEEESMSASFLQEMMSVAGHDVPDGGEGGGASDSTEIAQDKNEGEGEGQESDEYGDWEVEGEEDENEDEEETSGEREQSREEETSGEREQSREEMVEDFIREAPGRTLSFARAFTGVIKEEDDGQGEEMEDLFASSRESIKESKAGSAARRSASSGSHSSTFSKLPSGAEEGDLPSKVRPSSSFSRAGSMRRRSSAGGLDELLGISAAVELRAKSIAEKKNMQSMYLSTTLKRTSDPNERATVADVFKRMCDDDGTIFGNGLEYGDALILSALARIVHIHDGMRLFKQNDVVKDVAVVIKGTLAEVKRGAVYQEYQAGDAIGEVGLVSDQFPAQKHLEARGETAVVALMPFRKLNSMFERLNPDKSRSIYEFVNNILWPKYFEQDLKAHHDDMAIMVQCAFRCHMSRRSIKAKRNVVFTNIVIYVQRAWRSSLLRVKMRRVARYPHALVVQRNYKMHLARVRVERQKRIRERERMGHVEKDHTKVSFRDRVVRCMKVHHERIAAEYEERKKKAEYRSFMSMGSSAKFKDLAFINKWLYGLQSKVIKTWKSKVDEKKGKSKSAVNFLKRWQFASVFDTFKTWKTVANTDKLVVKPWKARPGMIVTLSESGKEFEFAHGKRLDGDTQAGQLLYPLMSDKTMWRVKWLATGTKASYYVGSCGRYHLKSIGPSTLTNLVHKQEMEREMEEARARIKEESAMDSSKLQTAAGGVQGNDSMAMAKRNSIAASILEADKGALDLAAGLARVREAMAKNAKEVKKTTCPVSTPFGGNAEIMCPSGSDWSIRVKFPERSVSGTVIATVRAIEAAHFYAERIDSGVLVSPMVEVSVSDIKNWSKSYSIRIPHRCSSHRFNLALFVILEGRVAPERMMHGVTFDSDYCHATVDSLGIFCVVNLNPQDYPDVVYGKLDLEHEWRDTIGKQMTGCYMGRAFEGTVWLIPKATLQSNRKGLHPMIWRTMPRFDLEHSQQLDRVKVSLGKRLEGCELNSWSGRNSWRGIEVQMIFHGIVQPIVGEDRPVKIPVVNAYASVLDQNGNHLADFDGPYSFRMQISNVELTVMVDMPGREPETYIRSLQGRETLLDIRLWVMKCAAPDVLSEKKAAWYAHLMFVNEKGETMSTKEEAVEQAAHHLPKVFLRYVEPEVGHRFGVWGGAAERIKISKILSEQPMLRTGSESAAAKRAPSGGGSHDMPPAPKPRPTSAFPLFGGVAPRPPSVRRPPSVPSLQLQLDQLRDAEAANGLEVRGEDDAHDLSMHSGRSSSAFSRLMDAVNKSASLSSQLSGGKPVKPKPPRSQTARVLRPSTGYEADHRAVGDHVHIGGDGSTFVPVRPQTARGAGGRASAAQVERTPLSRLSFRQVQDMTDKGLSLQKDIAEKVRIQMRSPPGSTAEQRHRDVVRTLKSPEVYRSLAVRGDGSVEWGPIGRLGGGGGGPASRPVSARVPVRDGGGDSRPKDHDGGERRPLSARVQGSSGPRGSRPGSAAASKASWRPSSGMKATAESMKRTPVMPSWSSRDDGRDQYLRNKVPVHSGDTGFTRA